MFELYSTIARQVGRVADDLIGNYLEYEWARYALLVIATGVEGEEIENDIKRLASDFDLRGEALALKLYDLSSSSYIKANEYL